MEIFNYWNGQLFADYVVKTHRRDLFTRKAFRGESVRDKGRKHFSCHPSWRAPSSEWQCQIKQISNDTQKAPNKKRKGGIKYDSQTPSWAPVGHFTLCLSLLSPPCNFSNIPRKGKTPERQQQTEIIFVLLPSLPPSWQDYTCIHGGIGMEFIS